MVSASTLALKHPGSPVERQPVVFEWTCDQSDPTNWVGIYEGDRRPAHSNLGNSLAWAYTNTGDSTVTVQTIRGSSWLSGGPYTAYLLKKGGYEELARSAPFTFRSSRPRVRAHAVADALTATPTAPGDAAFIVLRGLWAQPDGNPPGGLDFSKVSGDDWLSVTSNGTVSGNAPATALAHPATIVVHVKDSATGEADTITVQVPVLDPAGPLRLKIASWNLWDAGTQVTHALWKQLRVILTQNLDVVALQETRGTAAKALADGLGWHCYQSADSVGILSRYPLSDVVAATEALPAAAVRLQLPGGRDVRLWAAHLDETGYGPYAAQDGKSADQLRDAEKASLRLKQTQALVAAMRTDLASDTSVVLAAALSSPSHLDWVPATAPRHSGVGAVGWPVSAALEGAGLTDAFRAIRPDPATDPGDTWSPTRRYRGNKPEPQDRIDQVRFAARRSLTLVDAHTLVTGQPCPEPDAAANDWPSDSAAAVATFTL